MSLSVAGRQARQDPKVMGEAGRSCGVGCDRASEVMQSV
jgi:hypothetical protein